MRAFVTPETAHALEQHVGGREVGNDEVQVNVHALFDDLGGDEDRAWTMGGAVPAEEFEPVRFKFSAAMEWEAAVQEADTDCSFANGVACFAK